LEFLKEIFNSIYDVKALVMWAGYIGMFCIIFAETGLLAGFFFPGDSLLVTAGLFASTGDLNIVYLNMLLIPAAIIGDTTGYYIGHKAGPRLFKKEQSLLFRKDYLIKARNFYEKYGGVTIVIAKFMPFFRTFVPTVAGVAQMKYTRLLRYSIMGSTSWILSMTLIGFFLGRVVPNIDKHIEKVIVVIVFMSLTPAIYKFLKHKFGKKAAAKEVI